MNDTTQQYKTDIPTSTFGNRGISDDSLPVIDDAIEDVTATTRQYILQHYRLQACGILIGSLLLTLLLFRFAFTFLEEYAFLPLAIPIVAYGWLRDRIQGAFMRQFAEANNFQYHRHGPVSFDEKGIIFKQGRGRRVFNMVEGIFRRQPLRLFNYRYRVGYGRSSHDLSYTVFEIMFSANLPRMYLDAHKEGKVPGWRIKDLKKLTLESNEFARHFSLWIEEGKHIEALQTFTPDLMHELLQLPGKYDIELVDNQIYIYADGIVRTKDRLRDVFGLAIHLVENLTHVIEHMRPL